MKTHTLPALVGFALVLAALGATGCSVAPGGSGEPQGTSSEALCIQAPCSLPKITCGRYVPPTWGTALDFANGLKALGCVTEYVTTSNGHTYNQTAADTCGEAYLYCPATGQSTTMSIQDFTVCYANVSPVFAYENVSAYDSCFGGGQDVIDWDPTGCKGSTCNQ